MWSEHPTGMCSTCRAAYPSVARARADRVPTFKGSGIGNVEAPRRAMERSEVVGGTVQDANTNALFGKGDPSETVGIAQKHKGESALFNGYDEDATLAPEDQPISAAERSILSIHHSAQVPMANRMPDMSLLLGRDPGTDYYSMLQGDESVPSEAMRETRVLKRLTGGPPRRTVNGRPRA